MKCIIACLSLFSIVGCGAPDVQEAIQGETEYIAALGRCAMWGCPTPPVEPTPRPTPVADEGACWGGTECDRPIRDTE